MFCDTMFCSKHDTMLTMAHFRRTPILTFKPQTGEINQFRTNPCGRILFKKIYIDKLLLYDHMKL